LPPADSPFQSPQQRSKARAAKREAVLRAAVQMFNERGFHQTSLDDVAASLGISKPTIYHYLGNKDQVLLECVTIGLSQLLEAAEESRRSAGNGAQRLIAFLTRYAQVNMDDFGAAWCAPGQKRWGRKAARSSRRSSARSTRPCAN
jgi:AcrR family transcriptional regulator